MFEFSKPPQEIYKILEYKQGIPPIEHAQISWSSVGIENLVQIHEQLLIEALFPRAKLRDPHNRVHCWARDLTAPAYRGRECSYGKAG